MPNLVDYAVLSDGSFEIDSTPANSIPDMKILNFSVPSDFLKGTGSSRPVLAYICNFITDKGSFGIWINPSLPLLQSQRDHTLNWNKPDHHDDGLWECIQGTKFPPGKTSKVVIGCIKGRVRVRDVVMWYQRVV